MARRPRARVERSAGGVVLRRIDGVVHALLIRDPYRNWGLPKGHLEPGETPGEAALREVAEETGLSDLELGRALPGIDWFFRLEGRLVHKYCDFFLMESASGKTRPETSEGITECRWVALDRVEELITYDNAREVLRAVRATLEEASQASDPAGSPEAPDAPEAAP